MRRLSIALLTSLLAGCGLGPAPSVQAPLAASVEANALRGALTFSTPAFQRYNQELDRTICTLSQGTIIPGGMLTMVNDRQALDDQLNRQFYAPLFQDPSLLAQSQTQVMEWANTTSQYQGALRTAWEHVAHGEAPRDDLDRRAAAIYHSRKDRWQRLAARIGMPAPKAFHLYRGVKGDVMVNAVVQAWKSDASASFRFPLHTLSSWSLSAQTAFEFQAAWSDADPWIVFEAEVPFEKTLQDKWVDGSTFVDTYPGQHEVVVATSAEDELVIPDSQATVWLGHQRYTYKDRAAFLKAWEARLAAK